MTGLVVDAANVVGSRPDGWWKDRAGAARRLHEQLLVADLSYDEVVLVLEGEAKGGVRRAATVTCASCTPRATATTTIVAEAPARREAGDLVTASRPTGCSAPASRGSARRRGSGLVARRAQRLEGRPHLALSRSSRCSPRTELRSRAC